MDMTEDLASKRKHLLCIISKLGNPPEIDDITRTKDGRILPDNNGKHLWIKVIIPQSPQLYAHAHMCEHICTISDKIYAQFWCTCFSFDCGSYICSC